jgi:hypothetical protein
LELTDFYTRVLRMGLMKVDDKGVIRLCQSHSPAVQIGEKIMVMPTPEQIRNLGDNKEVFHPLAEDTVAGLSNVTKKLLERINFSLNITFVGFAMQLYGVALASSAKNDFTAEQLDLLQGIKTQPKKEIDFLKVVKQRLSTHPTSAFVEITLSRSGSVLHRGERVSRIAMVNFPFYNELVKDLTKSRKESDLDMSVDQVQMLKEIYETIFQNLDIAGEYNVGCGVRAAPFFTVLMKAARGLFTMLMRCQKVFPEMALEDELDLDYDWLTVLDDAEAMRRLANQYPNLEVTKNPIEKEVISSRAPELAPVPTQQASAPTAAPQRKEKESAQTYEEWAAGRASPSAMGALGQQREMIRRHNEGYRKYWNDHLATYRMPPPNMPNPDQIPSHTMAPMYPGMVPMQAAAPMAPMQPMGMMGQPMMPMQPSYPGMGQSGYTGMMSPGMQNPMMPMQPMQPMMPQGNMVMTPQGPMMQMPNGMLMPVQQTGMMSSGYGMSANPLSKAGGYHR